MKITENYQIKQNVKAYDKVYDKYEKIHGEIFNPIEQERLHKKLEQAVKSIKTNSSPKIAIDYGCGTGNITKHLIELGVYTKAADVSKKCLSIVAKKYYHTNMLDIIKINGQDLLNIKSNSCDLVVVYSVLHHVPDYLQIIEEMIRVLKPGGVILIDHEVNESYWNRNKYYIDFLQLAKPKLLKNWRRFLKLSNYITKIRQIINPRYKPEGDIHVWPDDHIEWDKIEDLLITQKCELVLKEDYLLYVKGYAADIYQKYKNKCNDMRVLIARKI